MAFLDHLTKTKTQQLSDTPTQPQMGALWLCYDMSHFPFSASQPMSATFQHESTPLGSLPPAASNSSPNSDCFFFFLSSLHSSLISKFSQTSIYFCSPYLLHHFFITLLLSSPSFLLSPSSLGFQLQTLRADTAH